MSPNSEKEVRKEGVGSFTHRYKNSTDSAWEGKEMK